MKKFLLMMSFALLLVPTSAFAQEKESAKYRFGLTFPSIGAIWHIADSIAFMSGIDFNHDWSRFGSGFDGYTLRGSGNMLGIDATLRFYLSKRNGMRFYLSPKYGFDWLQTEIVTDITTSNISSYNHSVSAAWGLQYALSDRIGIFGDIGVSYRRGLRSHADGHSNSIGTEGTWGLILYLK